MKYLEQNFSEDKIIAQIAKKCNISVSYYEKLFHEFVGVSPVEYRNIQKINQIKMLLQKNELTLDEIAEKIGCCDSGYLCRFFRKKTGMTSKEYRKIYVAQAKWREK